jgi:hypothetical protein
MTRDLVGEIFAARDGEAVPESVEEKVVTDEHDESEPLPETEGHEGPTDPPKPHLPEEREDGRMVPIRAVQEEREKRRKYTDEVTDLRAQISAFQRNQDEMAAYLRQQIQAQRQAPQQPQQPQEFNWDDPRSEISRAVQAALNPIGATVQNLRETTSRNRAYDKHGEEKVNAAYSRMETLVREHGPAHPVYQAIMRSGDMWGDLVNWHSQASLQDEIGNDPAAYEERIRAKLIEQLKSEGVPVGSQGSPRVAASALPTSLSGVRSSAPRTGPGWSGPSSIKDILKR